MYNFFDLQFFTKMQKYFIKLFVDFIKFVKDFIKNLQFFMTTIVNRDVIEIYKIQKIHQNMPNCVECNGT